MTPLIKFNTALQYDDSFHSSDSVLLVVLQHMK